MMDDGTFDVARFQNPLTIQTILNRAKTIAIVGLSANPLRASYFVGFYLRRHGYRIIPVNPRLSDWLGEMSYGSLSEIPADVEVDIVTVFRAPAAVPAIAEETVARGAGALWCQFTVVSPEGARIADEGGVPVVMDRCLKVEHARYIGRMHWLGFNTSRVTSVRGGLQ